MKSSMAAGTNITSAAFPFFLFLGSFCRKTEVQTVKVTRRGAEAKTEIEKGTETEGNYKLNYKQVIYSLMLYYVLSQTWLSSR